MDKGKKTEATNAAIAAVKQEGIASRLQGHIDSITTKLNSIAENAFAVGQELKQVQEEGDYGGTFEQFVKETFGKTRQWAYDLMEGFEAVKALPEHVKHVVQNPRQAAALASAKPEQRAAILEGVEKSGKKVTAKVIKAEVDRTKAVDAVEIPTDKLGTKIPPEILPEWNRAHDEAEWARGLINQVSKWFSNGLEEGKRDPIFRAVTMSNQKTFTDIKRQIGMVEPYAVCPTCKGSTKHDGKKCRHCKGTGFISKFEFENNSKEKKGGKKK